MSCLHSAGNFTEKGKVQDNSKLKALDWKQEKDQNKKRRQEQRIIFEAKLQAGLRLVTSKLAISK